MDKFDVFQYNAASTLLFDTERRGWMPKHRTRVGLHARNETRFPDEDFALIRTARIETLKTLSITDIDVYKRLRREHPDLEFIVRLFDREVSRNSRPSPSRFVSKMVPVIRQLQPYATKFEIHNEPNHASGLEGWGSSDDNARSFLRWYTQVLTGLRRACPWAKFGFPGLALNHPHRDLAWLDICRGAILASDWLGCHCYWQHGNMFSHDWGLRFKLYNQRFPEMRIEITEFANSTPGLSRDEIARQYVQYYQELNKYPYLGSACAFIASSPDPAWIEFVWRKEMGEVLPVVRSVGGMDRKAVDVPVTPPTPQPTPAPEGRTFPQTGKSVHGRFLEFFDRFGLDICGYPITEQFDEEGRQAQYFQRVALEELASGQTRLKMVGTEAWMSRPVIADLKAHVQELAEQLLTFWPAKPTTEDIVGDLPKHPTKRYETRQLADVKYLVIHHTASAPTVTPQRLAEHQVNKQDRAGIVYHFVVAADGKVYQTNRLTTVTDHASSRNLRSIGICFPGNFTDSIPTSAQLEAGGQLCAWLLGALRLPITAILGLREFSHTQSPGNQWLSGQRWKDKLLEQVQTATSAHQRDQEAFIESLQVRLQALQHRVRELEQQESLPVPIPHTPAGTSIDPPPIQNLIDTLTRHESKQYKTRPVSDIRYLVIHHSAIPASVKPSKIAAYHVKRLDWPGIGYHYLVDEDGTIYQGNTIEKVSYHAARMNPSSVGICFMGSFMKEPPPQAQIQAGAHLVAWLMGQLQIGLGNVKGHREFMQTACPGNEWIKGAKWKELLHQEVVRLQQEAAKPEPLGDKAIYHYMLFWAAPGTWAVDDWFSAQNYIGTFLPTAGFSADEAAHAKYVTIIGDTEGVPAEVERRLAEAGCRVQRIVGTEQADTKRILDDMAEQGKRFRNTEA
jgi:N-acetyl-anhydromuramyl-L-alanine amidase AmpD